MFAVTAMVECPRMSRTTAMSVPDASSSVIYGDDVTHVVTEEGIANLLLCRTAAEREQAIRGVAGFTDVGRARPQAG